MTGVSPLVTVIATQKLGKRTSKLVVRSILISMLMEMISARMQGAHAQ
uniref:Uncharacterized protein n=1 Tax=Candidatus Kentrum sp. FM TaxID=2126340 RepID=A0A450TJF2_9GAMM|nr:MAG: hypothetical protein BECKFM1743C_GA0114222_104003 [Candidatus Kentron sp. FM]VFJ67478.1 MAG: hypothetical protein BECKFM1743A_GA0114220_104482 [Candidatus Kentron sp. FM]VFK16335.1 MAG: hypothetical protein BECKFM1743B_GA0114221_104131 [Candidatus Kentron sp. FM]